MSLQTTSFVQVVADHLQNPQPTCADYFQKSFLPVKPDLEKVEHFLRQSLQSKVEGVPEMMAYLVESGGKRVRPLVSCLVAQACGYRGNDHIVVASVAELLHTATLYHDDVVDNSKLRRGRQTANSIFGNKIMVLAGDLMLAHSYALLMGGGYFEISQALSNTVRQMVEGEILQLQCEGDLTTTQDQYLEIIQDKTASLFAWCAMASGLLAGQSRTMIENLSNFGHHIGMAFQLVDDVMDFLSSRETMGKTPMQDLFEGKITLPLIVTLKHYPHIRPEMERFMMRGPSLSDSGTSVLNHLKNALNEPAILEDLKNPIRLHLTQAKTALCDLPPSIYKDALFSLVDFLANRDY